MTLNNLGNMYSDSNEYTSSEIAYMEALKIRKELSVSNPALFESFVAETLNGIGALYFKLKDTVSSSVSG